MDELEKIKERYNRRKLINQRESFIYGHFIKCERELIYLSALKSIFEDISKVKLIEIGAGAGDNLLAFKRMGFAWKNLYANELLKDRVQVLRENLKTENIFEGDASDLNFKDFFDIAFQSTVFTSILDPSFKVKLAGKMFDMTRNGGVILWYDFKYNNPRNADVRGIPKKEVKCLFPDAKKIDFFDVTLAPPIGRRVGRLYGILNSLWFLRTHVVAVIYK